MPELPEVETVRRILEPIVRNKTIKEINVYREKNLFPTAQDFVRNLLNETFLSVTRKGKYLIFHLTNRKAIISHLRMEGKYYEGKKEEIKDKHDIMRFVFDDDLTLRYNDVRKFGLLIYKKEDELWNTPPLNNLGEEPFSLSLDKFDALLKKKKGTIKEALLDQSLISGIGNIYDSEILYRSSISPYKKANSLNLNEEGLILKESIDVLNEAIKEGGSTIKSYHPKEGVSGMMQNKLLVYGKKGSSCPKCTFPIQRDFIANRSVFYCPLCQKVERPIIVGVTGPIASGKSAISSYLENKGYLNLDADKIVADLYQDPKIQAELKEKFGKEAIINGKINRTYLRELISQNPAKKEELENFIWPKVFSKIEEEIKASSNKRILLNVPLLIGSPLEEKCDLIIYIEASKEKQIERLLKRGKDPVSSLKLNESYPKEKAKKKASIVLNGDGSLEELYSALNQISYL